MSPDLTDSLCPTCRCSTASFNGRCPECGSAVQPKSTGSSPMTPDTTPLVLTGARLLALRRVQEAVFLTVELPTQADGMILPERLHVAFVPAVTLNLPPGVKASPETLEAAKRTARPELIVRTHRGPLPPQLEAIAEPLLPRETFALVQGCAIAGTLAPPDGSQGVVLDFGNGYMLQIDLLGVNLLQYPQELTNNGAQEN